LVELLVELQLIQPNFKTLEVAVLEQSKLGIFTPFWQNSLISADPLLRVGAQMVNKL
jgi:hypothetical protein